MIGNIERTLSLAFAVDPATFVEAIVKGIVVALQITATYIETNCVIVFLIRLGLFILMSAKILKTNISILIANYIHNKWKYLYLDGLADSGEPTILIEEGDDVPRALQEDLSPRVNGRPCQGERLTEERAHQVRLVLRIALLHLDEDVIEEEQLIRVKLALGLTTITILE